MPGGGLIGQYYLSGFRYPLHSAWHTPSTESVLAVVITAPGENMGSEERQRWFCARHEHLSEPQHPHLDCYED